MRFLANLSIEKIVRVLSRGAVPVDGQLWVQPPRVRERKEHAAPAGSRPVRQAQADVHRDAA
jgi:hypothetical protein